MTGSAFLYTQVVLGSSIGLLLTNTSLTIKKKKQQYLQYIIYISDRCARFLASSLESNRHRPDSGSIRPLFR